MAKKNLPHQNFVVVILTRGLRKRSKSAKNQKRMMPTQIKMRSLLSGAKKEGERYQLIIL